MLLTEQYQENSKSDEAENGFSTEMHACLAENEARSAAAEAAEKGIPQSRRRSEPW